MTDMAIRAENLSKQYKIKARRYRHDSLRDLLADRFKSLFRKPEPLSGHETFWALKNVSFEIERGEILGIIGRNGAGKSTLLKILACITEPTSGRAEIYGRIGSLLEVGTGFDRELNGRENIYLSGAVLGMKKREIDRKFDDIVAFADVEKFIETPLKHFSSGMYVRLAFAVAAHLEPEILLIDEVLAVGDARFQKKCLNKMEDVGKQGRTVLFVSHDMQAITRLCQRTLLLDEGRVLHDGPTYEVVKTYLNSGLGSTACREWPDPKKAPGGDVARLCAVRVRAEDGKIAEAVDIRRPFTIEMEYDVLKGGYVLLPHFSLVKATGEIAFVTVDLDPSWRQRKRPAGRYKGTVLIPGNLLSEGMFFVHCSFLTVTPDKVQFWAPEVVGFQVIDSLDGDSARGDYVGHMPGVVRPFLKWTNEYTGEDRSATVVAVEEQRL